jgi:hypothetical protein
MRHKIAALLATVTVALAASVPAASVADAQPLPSASPPAPPGFSNSLALAASASTAGGLGSIDATSIAQQLLSSVAKSAGSKIGGAIAGWALDSIFGSSVSPTEELKQQINALQNDMTSLKTQVNLLGNNLTTAIKQLKSQVDRDAYETEAGLVNHDAATLVAYQKQFDSWLQLTPGDPKTVIDGSKSSELQTMRSTLDVIINDLDVAMIGTPTTRGLIAIYGSVIQDQDPYPVGRFYTSDFTTPVSNQLDYYEDLAVQAFNMLAEVYHLSWTIGNVDFTANDALVEDYATFVPTMLANWNQMATSGVGRLPDGVVADTSTGLMWSRSNLTLGGKKVFCWSCLPDLSLSTLLTPTTIIDGLSGWAVPSQAQLAALVAGNQKTAFTFLTANGFQWQQSNGTILIGGSIPFTIPAYWVNGGTTVDFANGGSISFHDQNYWAAFLPGPGAIAVRSIG